MSYNPYDLVVLRIGGEEIHGRPYEFDSTPVNQMTMENEFGGIVKPTHISTVCPQCGQGINVENIELPDPPFPVIDWVCQHCNPGAQPPVNAFMNPLDAGRIAEHELDPLMHDPDEQVVTTDTTVAERLGVDAVETETVATAHSTSALLAETTYSEALEPIREEAGKIEKTAKKRAKKKAKKKAKKRSPIKGAESKPATPKTQEEPKETAPLVTESKPAVVKEKADGMKPEFDDDDLVENE